MNFINFFLSKKKKTANIAKKRLQIIISEESKKGYVYPYYIVQLKQEILKVISKYVEINPNMINIELDDKKKNISKLELNITLPKTKNSFKKKNNK
ncbi:cell division topological specificity factor MinE [Enterobacteriaceae endosymbiont of Donacia bicoloricornis]|uniref:cell division topological specificity factor MinE n=1 Tax=Enterobacteriaceae endosymbiont of Donacia bicoloricornis TaxID=2675772 RepID=UPI0014494EAF|nr:cell division topological specificity factor MinE [Enterobacteriaceae endosymbiont of Donacia bicoloricornis]QJC37651.1 cell division topological specificity factor MinE [Enterobacteriaceae endosymbiont of Donacia bicoloricornis]